MSIFLPLDVQEFIILGEHILFGVTTLLNAIALVCLIKHTHPNQKEIRNYLIYIQISLILVDVFVDLLTTPIAIFPAFGLYCVGPLCQAGLSPKIVLGLMCPMLGNTALAVTICVIFKHQNVMLPSSRYKFSERMLVTIRLFLFVCDVGLPSLYLITPVSDVDAVNDLIDSYPFNITWIRDRGPYYLEERTIFVVLLSYVAIGLSVLDFSILLLLFSHMLAVLKVETMGRSLANASKIRRSLKILFAQLIIPLAIFIAPAIVLFTGIATETWISFETCLSMLYLITLHSVVHNILLLTVTPSYRLFIVSIITCRPQWHHRTSPQESSDPPRSMFRIERNKLAS